MSPTWLRQDVAAVPPTYRHGRERRRRLTGAELDAMERDEQRQATRERLRSEALEGAQRIAVETDLARLRIRGAELVAVDAMEAKLRVLRKLRRLAHGDPDTCRVIGSSAEQFIEAADGFQAAHVNPLGF